MGVCTSCNNNNKMMKKNVNIINNKKKELNEKSKNKLKRKTNEDIYKDKIKTDITKEISENKDKRGSKESEKIEIKQEGKKKEKIKQEEELITEDNNFIFSNKILKENSLYYIKKYEEEKNKIFSTEKDYDKIIKSNQDNKILISTLLLQLKERNWIKESIELSEMTLKRIDNDINKILYRLIKLYEDFNWLVESLATFYYYSVYKKEDRKFPDNFLNDIKLPSLNSIDWFNGFEWKGLFIRIQKYSHSKNLFNEMKALNFLFFDYIQIIDNSKIGNNNLLSNNIIFPLFSYSEICGMILFATPIIYYINSDNIYFEKEVFNLSNNNNENKEISKNLNNEFDNIYKEELENSEIFSRISSNNLLKINNPEYGKLPKYLVININNCIPSLFSFSSFKNIIFFLMK